MVASRRLNHEKRHSLLQQRVHRGGTPTFTALLPTAGDEPLERSPPGIPQD
ncbi:hypothetical protein GCD22_02819 [Acidithiobacillus thiooxidans ATCC 19377]|uniref:Uncharacterized protein n=1 Tax=Acidithiobacillus thiooxidans ATCC 19377 TaxID=637390 RepID=A0A5P9XTK3_ACITH|nr:hypothetical protein GCD22_02819 [Acidithiobacillus thiooxidans ATCC 19377]